jgi:hypothetical protein
MPRRMIPEVNASIARSQILSSSVLTSCFDKEQQSLDIIRICLYQDSAFAQKISNMQNQLL